MHEHTAQSEVGATVAGDGRNTRDGSRVATYTMSDSGPEPRAVLEAGNAYRTTGGSKITRIDEASSLVRAFLFEKNTVRSELNNAQGYPS